MDFLTPLQPPLLEGFSYRRAIPCCWPTQECPPSDPLLDKASNATLPPKLSFRDGPTLLAKPAERPCRLGWLGLLGVGGGLAGGFRTEQLFLQFVEPLRNRPIVRIDRDFPF